MITLLYVMFEIIIIWTISFFNTSFHWMLPLMSPRDENTFTIFLTLSVFEMARKTMSITVMWTVWMWFIFLVFLVNTNVFVVYENMILNFGWHCACECVENLYGNVIRWTFDWLNTSFAVQPSRSVQQTRKSHRITMVENKSTLENLNVFTLDIACVFGGLLIFLLPD